MNKILAGFIGLAMLSAVVGGTAYALFTSTATASGITFATGNADLRIWKPSTSTWETDWSPDGMSFINMYPGYGGSGSNEPNSTEYERFYLKNLSTSPIGLDVAGKLRAGVVETVSGVSWNTLKDVVYVAVVLPDWSAGTGWHTLDEWYTNGFTLPGGSLLQNTQREYRFYVRVDSTAGNEIAGQGISAVNFDFTGTQAP